MSQRFDVYLPGDSWLHHLDPRTKLWVTLLMGATGLVFQHITVQVGLLIGTHLFLLAARVPAERVRWLWARLLPLVAVILILQPFFAPGPGPALVALGPVRLTVEGMLVGVSFALRAAALTFIAALLLVTTEANDLVAGLVRLGLPYTWGLTLGLAIRYLPTVYGLFVTVSEAQQARGWIVERGSLLQRARAYVPILVATVIAGLRLSDNLGLALAARGLGYPAKRTSLHSLHFGAGDWAFVLLTGAAFAGLMVVRYGVGLGAAPW
ncbi:MAG: energy-coupling factor transporter transmembrane protein EcfT [Anaerolineae bacterium]|nr:energy-coupling factor transporter transmembrane protein EcfT [Anaerolineae bacterium]